jgi:hypothetical protein
MKQAGCIPPAAANLFLMVFLSFVRFVDVTVERGESAEERNADQVFDSLDVLVEVYEGVHRFDLSD